MEYSRREENIRIEEKRNKTNILFYLFERKKQEKFTKTKKVIISEIQERKVHF